MYEGLEDLKVDTVNRKTLAKQVIERIVHLLSSGQLRAGDKLPTEMELMDILHVSRPVLREALSSLETLGVITRKTRGGTYFNDKIGMQPFSVMLALATDNLPAIIEARMALELGLVTIAAEKSMRKSFSVCRRRSTILPTALTIFMVKRIKSSIELLR